ncbi:MAG: hypothetical protein ACT4PL_07955, partial [Phycisphaerales bacterium]
MRATSPAARSAASGALAVKLHRPSLAVALCAAVIVQAGVVLIDTINGRVALPERNTRRFDPSMRAAWSDRNSFLRRELWIDCTILNAGGRNHVGPGVEPVWASEIKTMRQEPIPFKEACAYIREHECSQYYVRWVGVPFGSFMAIWSGDKLPEPNHDWRAGIPEPYAYDYTMAAVWPTRVLPGWLLL